MTEKKLFHLGTVLSITTGRLFSPQGIGGVYEICEFMSGEQGLMTHQLPRVCDEIKPYVLLQHPNLANIVMPDTPLDTYERIFTWMDTELYDTYGEMLELTPMPDGEHTVIDPISELLMKKPDAQVIVVGVDEEFEEE